MGITAKKCPYLPSLRPSAAKVHSSVVVVVANSKAEKDLLEPELKLERRANPT